MLYEIILNQHQKQTHLFIEIKNYQHSKIIIE